MLAVFPFLAALTASFGWATGIVLAQMPAKALGAFEFTRIQLIACSLLMAAACTVFGLWHSIDWLYWPSFVVSTVIGVVLGNLTMIECLRLGGPRLTELLLCLKAPIVAVVAFLWIGETLGAADLIGGTLILAGLILAIQFGGGTEQTHRQRDKRIARVLVLGVLAAGFQGLGFVAVKPALTNGAEPLAIAAIRLLGAAGLILLFGLWRKQSQLQKTEVTPYLLFRTILPGVIGYIVSSSLLLYAYANIEAALATILGSLSPLFVLPILWFADGKKPSVPSVVGAAIAVAGAAAIVWV
ncbi:MAG: DMT family transporter [Roseibium sp.]|uniref:DMT family transporter n=1 Tax=Roseibium sp. TaxID=1936156 RepID=UPI002621934B|nr:DMT family transporter [Roseibium sp.]MCV0429774.1 DMT family transporter [Roseibium sp.]